ncbi:MAG: hypothetical protein RL117_888 [Verrucomicrobiota bacterium]|jgi:hypothetical protein
MKEYSYKDPSGLSKLVVALLIYGAILNIAAAFSSYFEYELLSSIKEGAQVPEEIAYANDNRQATIGLSQTILFGITSIFFGKWIYRISCNAHYFSRATQRYSPGWAVGFYFIPIVNLWRPYQALRDAYEGFIDFTRDHKDNLVFPLWWFAWIVSNFLGRILFRSSMRDEEINEMIQTSLISVVSDSFDIFLDVMALLLVIMVTKACLTHQKKHTGEQVDSENV